MCDDAYASLVRYARSNGWDALRHIRRTPQNVWSWEQPELAQQIYWLRASVQHPGHAQLPRHYRAKIRCNLGNALSGAGRFVEALAEWRIALTEQPNLGMAHGNMGKELVTYAHALYDEGHAVLLLQHARRELHAALAGGTGWAQSKLRDVSIKIARNFDASTYADFFEDLLQLESENAFGPPFGALLNI